MNIALAYGGKSAEHTVSIHSAMTIEKTLHTLGYEVSLFSIDLAGVWHLEQAPVSEKPACSTLVTVMPGKGFYVEGKKLPVDVLFPVTHGHQGEDGCIQGLCAMANVPCAGCDVLASSVMMYKTIATLLFREAGIPTVETYTLEENTIARLTAEDDFSDEFKVATSLCGEDLFIKPEDCGSSIGVTALPGATVESFQEAVLLAHDYAERVLIQRLVKDMVEVECAVLEDREYGIVVSDPLAVYNPASSAFLTYEVKYRAVDGDKLVRPEMMTAKDVARMKDYARKAFIVGKCHGYARVDFFYAEGKIMINEINTLPGMTSTSHYPVLIAQSGYSLASAVEQMIQDAIAHWSGERGRSYTPPED